MQLRGRPPKIVPSSPAPTTNAPSSATTISPPVGPAICRLRPRMPTDPRHAFELGGETALRTAIQFWDCTARKSVAMTSLGNPAEQRTPAHTQERQLVEQRHE